MPALVRDLERLLGKEKVRADSPTLTAYSIDSGIYKVTPQAVVLAQVPEDIEAVIRYAQKSGTPVTARSGGTNLTGSAIGEGIILDSSRMNRIVEVNREEKWVRVQPGMIYQELNADLARYGLMFAPDPSSGEMCKVGGMLATNAAGPHTLKYGATKDNTLEITAVLADGEKITAREYEPTDPDLQSLLSRHEGIARLYQLIQQHSALIRQKKPMVTKNSSGYNLFALAEALERKKYDLVRLFVGSEGTLGITTEAILRLVPRPLKTATALLYFTFLEDVAPAVMTLLTLSPSALELMDANALDLVGRERLGIPQEAQAMLLIECDSDVTEQVHRLQEAARDFRLSSPIILATDPARQEALWRVRKAIYPTLYRADPKKKPIHFVDDVVVRAERLPELISFVDRYFRERGVLVAIYGHIGDGNAHINPLLDLNNPDDLSRMIRASRDIHSAVITRFGGSICGEHGDGRVRAEFLIDLYGEELYGLFCETKRLLDPHGILNPGVKISTVSFTERIDYERFTKPCATCGKCNPACPVYDIFQEESNGARGWFHIVTAPDYSFLQSRRVVEACLNCKSCRTICPAGVDVSDLILQKRAEHPNRFAGAIFFLQERRRLFEGILKILGRTQPVWDTPLGRTLIEIGTRPLLALLAKTAEIPREMILPRLATRTLRERFRELTEEGGKKGAVAYFHGCAANYFLDGVGEAIVNLLTEMGVDLVLPTQLCSGTPIMTYGHIDRTRRYARFNIDSLLRYEKVITGCASCHLMLKDYPRYMEGDDQKRATELAKRVYHITEYLVKEARFHIGKEKEGVDRKIVTYHSSCHLRAAGVHSEPREILKSLPGMQFVEMRDADRCAGGAGTFIVKNYTLSREIFQRKSRAVRETGADIVATSCPACLITLKNGLRQGVTVTHIAQLAWEAYKQCKV